MTDIKTCDKEGCSNTFDIDNGEGVIKSTIVAGIPTNKYYCCIAHMNGE